MFVQFAPANGSNYGMFSYRNIYRSYLDCRKNKRTTLNSLRFEINADANIVRLEQELQNHTYHPSQSILFVAKKPKSREIFAGNFKDRVVHHLLVRELEAIWERIFIHDSYACRKDKGTHKAVDRLQEFQRQITSNGYVRAYYLQLDIKDFFTSINKELLFALIRRKVNNPELLWLTENILFWDCTKSYVKRCDQSLLDTIPANKSLFGKNNLCGLPIGNLTSQFFANIYLNELDQFVKHKLKAHYYLRYVDDFILLSRDKEELSHWKNEIMNFLTERLNLQLHPKRQKLDVISNGIDFLGYIVRQNYSLVRNRVINNFKAQLAEFRFNPDRLKLIIPSFLGHCKWANTYRLIHKLNLQGEI